MKLPFKNRIAFYYTLMTATIVAVVFLVIYFIVSATVLHRLNGDIRYEAGKHMGELRVANDQVSFKNKVEWLEREHQTIEVNPVFVQVISGQGQLVDKSPNLKEGFLQYDSSKTIGEIFDTQLSGQSIRQVQYAVMSENKTVGHLLVAMSLENALLVLSNLKQVLLIAFPIVLLTLFLFARLIAGRSIQPVTHIIHTASHITRENLSDRITVPGSEDEIATLVTTINELLNRIENAVEREKQFTSDASHELRTPLAVMKGTLEVLIRKPREAQEYRDKIAYCISEIDRMNHRVDQLLLLARFESQKTALDHRKFDLVELLENVIYRQQAIIQEKELKVDLQVTQGCEVESDPYMVDIILENLLSNAIKYSHPKTSIDISVASYENKVFCTIQDNGIGMQQEELSKIFGRFYRSEALTHPQVKGSGLGLSIVKRMCELLHISLKFNSVYQKGTAVELVF
jgi:signal transduction histidine kinase